LPRNERIEERTESERFLKDGNRRYASAFLTPSETDAREMHTKTEREASASCY